MTFTAALRALLFALAAMVSLAAGAASDRGSFGFAVSIDADGVFSPTLKSAVIQSVEPGLPAAAAGLAPGDSVLEVQGTRVEGSKASDIAALMKRKPGESVLLKLKRTNGEVYSAKLVAVERP